MGDLPTGTVTFLMTDIEGSTRRWAEDPGMADALAVHDSVIRAAIETCSGHWVKHTGDGALAVFDRPEHALEAASGIQAGLAHAPWPGVPLRVRIGLHSGSATVRDGDYYGLPVSAAARVMDAGHGGQVLVSAVTASLAGRLPDGHSLSDLGPHRLKDLETAQHLHQLVVDGLEADFPPLRTLERVYHNLPLQLTSFIGREHELKEVRGLVDGHRLVTLTGVGGAGKTRLSLQVAAEMARGFPGGVRFVELAPLSDPGAVPAAFAAALDVDRSGGGADSVKQITMQVGTREMLVVVDNCEHVLGAVSDVVRRLLEGSPGLRIIASSREGLGVPGERIWQIPSLQLGSANGDSEAVMLFAERASAVTASFALTPETRPHVEEICRLLDGVPLAIELAAARSRVLTPGQIAQRLSDRFRLLTGGSKAALPRQQTLEAAVDWSYQLLSEQERLLYERLSVFHGGFTLEAAEVVCADERVNEVDVLDVFTALVDKSMVNAAASGGSGARFEMLETLRQFAVRRLLDRGEMEAWKDRHARWVIDSYRSLDLFGFDGREEARAWLMLEAENCAAAHDWAGGQAEMDQLALLAAHGFARLFTGDLRAARTLFDAAADIASDPAERGLLLASGLQTSFGVPRSGAHDAGAEILDLSDRMDDRTAAFVLGLASQAVGLNTLEDGERAVPLGQAAVARASSLTAGEQALAAYRLSWVLLWAGRDPEEAIAVLEDGIALAEAGGNAELRGWLLGVLRYALLATDKQTSADRWVAIEDQMIGVAGDVDDFDAAWVGIRRAQWELVEPVETAMAQSRGVDALADAVVVGLMQWNRGRLDAAASLLEQARQVGFVGRWHHDYYPTVAEVAALRGDDEGLARAKAEHLALDLRPLERSTVLGTLRAVVHREVDQGDLAGATATVDEMRALLDRFPRGRAVSFQIWTPRGYLLCAEAELTRLTGPDPDAWAVARDTAVWAYWDVYCEARRVEAMLTLGHDAGADLMAVIEWANRLDLRWISSLLTSLR